jgi:hypothetical protein
MVKNVNKPMLETRHGMLFRSAEEAWFWFVTSWEAKRAGAAQRANQSLFPRPCAPLDIQRLVMRLHKTGKITAPQLRVMITYGTQHLAPDATRPAEAVDAYLWRGAMNTLTRTLQSRDLMEKRR